MNDSHPICCNRNKAMLIKTIIVLPHLKSHLPGSDTAGRDWETHGAVHNWPSVFRVREGLTGRDVLVPSRTTDSCVVPGAVHADMVTQCFL